MMRIRPIYSVMAACSLAVSAAQADEPWQDPAVNELNRLPARAFAPPLASEEAALSGALEPETPYVLSLDGTWKFDWVGSPAQRPLDFWRTDFDESSFGEIDVPSCVEMRGHGIPHYTNSPYPFRKDPPRIDDEYNSISSYRRTFTIPSGWEGRRVILRFEGVGSAFFVWVNGHKVGYGEDSYLPSEFDITEYVREVNLLAVQVFHWCDGSYLEDQDMFRFSGLFRSVKLVAEPTDGVGDFVVKASADGRLEVEVGEKEKGEGRKEKVRMELSLYNAERKNVGELTPLSTSTYSLHLDAPHLWSAEDPYLYTLVIRRGADIRSCEVGFRDVRIDGVRFLVNGRPMKFRGVNRHESSPRNGRTLTAEEMIRDVVMMKRANIDTVRTAHYPDDPRWYRLCDRYGIYLVAEADVEAHGMGYKEEGLGDKPEWTRSIVERNERHVRAYRNHPSVIMWSLGNETGPGPNFVAARDAVRALDGTRPVHYERQPDDMDVDAAMYMPIDWLRDYKEKGKPFFMSEYAHAMGNALGEFERYWDTYLSREVFAGGCIWDWIDQAVWQVTERGEPYLAYGGDWDETPHQYNFCCNGLITPDRAWTPKLEHVRWVHRQLAVTRRDGRLWLQNRFAFTSADAFDGSWRLLSDGREIASGAFDVPAVAPGGTGRLEGLERSVATAAADARGEVLLNVSFALRTATAWAERGYEIARDQVAIAGGFRPFAAATGAAHPFEPAFDAKTGELVSLKTGGRELLAGPPRLTCERAFCDNDWKWLWSGKYPDELGFTASGLNRLTYNLRGRSDVTTGGVRTVRTLYRVQGWRSAGFDHEIVWTFRRDGVLEMRNKVTPFGKMGALPRLGTTWKIAPGLEKLTWYGRGPLENYCDRKGSEFLGLHTGTVTGQYVPYVRPQMCGGKCDVRHVTLADDDGRGVTFAGSVPLFVTALHYSPEDILSARPGRDQSRRVAFKPPRAETWLDLDVGQTGLGNNSCGPMPNVAERYRAVPVEWTVYIRPQGDSADGPVDGSAERNPSPLVVDLVRVGTIRPRSADEIRGSNWTLGCECLDRDFADFDQYRDYIVPLGMKEIRLMAGWAKCEREKGVFDFAWLDRCVDWARAHGVNVYLDISYGNPIYPGAGDAGLAGGIPNTSEGLAAWDNWIEKLGAHYAGRIVDYAMWNEPDNGGKNPPAAIADLNVRTARILKRLVPGCRLHGLSLGALDADLFEACLSEIVKLGGQDLFDTFVYHGYAFNPDTSYETVDKLIEICARLAPKARMRQGENGCPSEWVDFNALSFYPWSENSQAKWDMRRMLGDLGHGCRSTVYTICDLQYRGPHAPYVNMNRKGLLRCNADRRVIAVKKSYYAVQNVTAVFDDTLSPVKDRTLTTSDRCLSLYEYAAAGGAPLFVFWDHGHPALRRERQVQVEGQPPAPRVTGAKLHEPVRAELPGGFKYLKFEPHDGTPTDGFTTRPAVFERTGEALRDPVWIDLFTGAIYAFPEERQIRHSRGVTFVRVPVYDSPCVLTERGVVAELPR